MSEVKECNIETDTMWYGFSTTGLYDYIHDICKDKDRIYEVKYDECGDDDYVVKLTFKEVIDIEKPTEPYIICSTEY
jgi:hypothetical protein